MIIITIYVLSCSSLNILKTFMICSSMNKQYSCTPNCIFNQIKPVCKYLFERFKKNLTFSIFTFARATKSYHNSVALAINFTKPSQSSELFPMLDWHVVNFFPVSLLFSQAVQETARSLRSLVENCQD